MASKIAANALTEAQVSLIYARMDDLQLKDVADLVRKGAFEYSTVSKLLHRERGPSAKMLQRLAEALEIPLAQLADPDGYAAAADGHNTRVTKSLQGLDTQEATGVRSAHRPIPNAQLFEPRPENWPRGWLYEWGTCGVPDGGGAEAAQPVDWLDYPADEGAVRMIGTAGFAVRVQGDSMLRWGLEPGDIVWINPRQGRTAGLNRPVLARILDDAGGDMGMAIKVLRQNAEGMQHLESDGDGPIEVIPAGRFEFLGVAVWREPHGRTLRRQTPDRSGESESVRFLGEDGEGTAISRRAG